MPNILFPLAIGNRTATFLDETPLPDGLLIEAGARARSQGDALAYSAFIKELSTGDGLDAIEADARATGGTAAEARGLSIGDATGLDLFGAGTADLGADDDTVSANATARLATANSAGLALKLDASGVTVDLGSAFATGSGNDFLTLSASAVTTGAVDNPDLVASAAGFESLGATDLGDGADMVMGRGVADTDGLETLATLAFGITQVTPDGVADGAFVTTDSAVTVDNDTLMGRAAATGEGDVGAFGVLLADARMGAGADTIQGRAAADGVASTDARGVSVGVSDIDDDTLQNPQDSAAVLPAAVGTLRMGGDADTITGRADVVANDAGLDIFFAGANGIVVDGGTEEQLFALLDSGLSLDAALDQLDTSALLMGGGNDTLIADVNLNVTGGLQGGDPSGEGDPDLEVIADGIENAGTIDLGAGDDFVSSTVNLVANGGAKGLADALDNSSVGIITGLGLEVNDRTHFDMGTGNNRFESNISATVVGDLAAADGLGNRGTFDAGSGNDTFDLNATASFTRDELNPGDQEEAIADGWENRNDVSLGDGDDSVIANASASGNGILTIAEGIESREFFDAGAGNDFFDLTATATSTVGVLADNLTQAAGLQTEQIDSGTFLMGDGDDLVRATGVATSDGLENRATLAFGITQVTGDAPNAGEAGLLDTTADVVTSDNDTLTGTASASGEADVESFGVLLTNAITGAGSDTVIGAAAADGKDFAQANGVAIGVSENVPGQVGLLPDEAGTLLTGDGADVVTGAAQSTTVSGAQALFNDADAVLVDLGSVLDTGAGIDVIDGQALAVDIGHGGGAFSAVVADGVENRGTLLTGAGADIIEGFGETRSNQAFSVAGGIDNGLGSTQNGIPVAPLLDTGAGADRLTGASVSSAVGANAFSGGIENFGTILTGADDDVLTAQADSTVTLGEAGDLSNADGIDNRFRIETGDGNDVLDANATATAEGGVADAIGIRNDLGGEADNVIDLGSGSDQMIGVATATATVGNATAFGISGGTVITDPGGATAPADDLISGSATAAGTEDVGAFGTLLVDATTRAGADTVSGVANASVVGGAGVFGVAVDGRGISVGLSDIDDDSLQNPGDPSSPPARVGTLNTGGGADILDGTANVTANVGHAEDIFFAGANGIVVDGPTEQQLFELLDGLEPTPENIAAILGELDTSALLMGGGADQLIANVTLDVTGGLQGGDPSGEGDPDLEVIADGIENAGLIDLGNGNDSVDSTVTLTATGGAKGLADALDNSSVGIITGLLQEVNDFTVFDMGAGNDSFTSNISATVTGDLAAADGLGNRGTFRAGSGDDTFNLNATASFTRDELNPGDQEEAIADGWENRNDVFLGEDDDSVTATARASGNGILTIAEGIESRDFFDAGSGNDTFDLTAVARSTSGVLADNLTQAAGLQTEQVDAGTFLLGDGDDAVVGRARATSGEANRGTVAFGITQVTAEDASVDVGLLDAGIGADSLTGRARATGQTDVDAFGVLMTNTLMGDGADAITGNAGATGVAVADAVGIGVGVSDNALFDDEAGTLDTGADADTLDADAAATADAVIGQASAVGIAVATGSVLETDAGNDVLDGAATATGRDAEAFGIAATGLGGLLSTGGGADSLTGTAHADGAGSLLAFGVSSAAIDTGAAGDSIVGTASASGTGTAQLAGVFVGHHGLAGGGSIETGTGGDSVTGSTSVAAGVMVEFAAGIFIDAGATLNLGGGADAVAGLAPDAAANDFDGPIFGIAGAGELRGGAGNDTIFADSFGGGIDVLTGGGDDTVTGFGEAEVNGGADFDRLVFDFDFFGLGGEATAVGANRVDFELDGITLESRNFEEFEINGTIFDPDGVQLA